jgi:DNA-binding NtrC family response regulator
MPQKRRSVAETPPVGRQRLLIFSPDVDLANSLKLLLEDRYEVVKVTQLECLEESLKQASPALLLVDLYSTSQDCLKQLLYLERLRLTVPLILLRAYRSNTLIDDAIKRLNAYVFYKPVNVDMVVNLVQELTGATAQR